jgi:mono/diheme cytochrome c family protein
MQGLVRQVVGSLALALVCAAASAQEGGKYLTILGDCAACHTETARQPFAGGRALISPFGTFYTPNITPDRETGIGSWTADDFWRALHDGISKSRGRLYPAMPYPHYTLYSRADSDAMYAYLQSLAPIRNEPRKHEIPFPFSLRSVMIVWNGLYLHKGEYVPDPARSARWNRGAYLVKGPGHCGACHTPKNSLYADREELALSGNIVENWWAADLTSDDREGLGGWSSADIVEYLKTGRNRHLMAAGPMVDVITVSTSRMRHDDLAAIADYLKSLPPVLEPEAVPEPAASTMRAGRAQFRTHCQDCHNYDGTGVPRRYQALVGVPTVQARNPTTVLRVILEGQEPPAISARPDDEPMPAFVEKMTDGEVADVATYIRNAWGNRAPPVSAQEVGDLREKLAAEKRAAEDR